MVIDLLEKLLEDKEFKDIFQPIEKEEFLKQNPPFLLKYGEPFINKLRSLGYNADAWTESRFGGYGRDDPYEQLGIKNAGTRARVTVTFTGDVTSDIYKALNKKALHTLADAFGLKLCRGGSDGWGYHDTYKTAKPGIRRKRLVFFIKKKK